MRKLMMIAIPALAAAMAGCTSTRAEWGGERVITDADGKPLVAADGTVQKVKEPVKLTSWRHWMDTHVDTAQLDVQKERIAFTVNGYKAEPSEELAKLVDVSLKGAAELAAKIGAAIATSGGSVAGDAAKAAIKKAINNFISKGGNVNTATVSCEGGACTISDGTVTETCTDCGLPGWVEEEAK